MKYPTSQLTPLDWIRWTAWKVPNTGRCCQIHLFWSVLWLYKKMAVGLSCEEPELLMFYLIKLFILLWSTLKCNLSIIENSFSSLIFFNCFYWCSVQQCSDSIFVGFSVYVVIVLYSPTVSIVHKTCLLSWQKVWICYCMEINFVKVHKKPWGRQLSLPICLREGSRLQGKKNSADPWGVPLVRGMETQN